MIIEIFGPPGVGKTTFSHLLAERLRDRGYTVDLVLTLPRREEHLVKSRWIHSSPAPRLSSDLLHHRGIMPSHFKCPGVGPGAQPPSIDAPHQPRLADQTGPIHRPAVL